MKAEGSPLSKGQVESILRGDVLSNVPIGEHLMAERLRVLLKKLWAFSEENIDYGLRLTEGIYCILSGKDKAEYRKRSILVREWDFSPALRALLSARLLYATRSVCFFSSDWNAPVFLIK